MRSGGGLLAAAAVAWSAAGAARAAAPPAIDDQIWSEVDVAARVGPAQVTVLGVVREGDGLPDPAFSGVGVTADVPLGRGFVGTAGDIWAWIRVPQTGATIHTQLPLFAVSYGWSWKGFHVSDRNRAEDILYVPGLGWRYRNRLSVEHALALGPVRGVFLSDEVFYDAAHHLWSRSRTQAGLVLRAVGPASLQVFYLRQDDREERPGAINALGLTLRLQLR